MKGIWIICVLSDMKNVILTGFMGTGKSSVGKELALRLNYRYIDLDSLIVAEAGISINEIFAKSGEDVFRSLESKILVSLKGEERIVLSTGGGAVIADENRHVLHTLGAVINLSASAEERGRRRYLELMAKGEAVTLEETIADAVKRDQQDENREHAPLCRAIDAIEIDSTGLTIEDVLTTMERIVRERLKV